MALAKSLALLALLTLSQITLAQDASTPVVPPTRICVSADDLDSYIGPACILKEFCLRSEGKDQKACETYEQVKAGIEKTCRLDCSTFQTAD